MRFHPFIERLGLALYPQYFVTQDSYNHIDGKNFNMTLIISMWIIIKFSREIRYIQ